MADYLCPYCHALYREAQNHCPSDGSMLIEVPQVNDLSGQVLRRKYKLERSLGQGGFGSVYQATHLVLGKTVAVKVLRSEFRQDATMVARFFNEARVVTRLTNPHTIQTFDLDQTEDGLLFMVMEYVSGRTLRELAQQEGEPAGRLPWKRSLALLMQVCDSLEEAHSQSVIHRDLKPDNIMVSNRGGEMDFATVLDFGIAKVLEGANIGLTAAGSLIGSPAYMSPEQILGRPLDARSDLYSFGAVAYQVLSGALPVNAKQTAAILQEKVLLPPTPMSVKMPGLSVPPELDQLVVSLLATNPDHRPSSAMQLKETMAGFLGTGSPILIQASEPRTSPSMEGLSPVAAGTVAYGAPATGSQPVSKVVVAVDANVDETVELRTANAGGQVAGVAAAPVYVRPVAVPVIRSASGSSPEDSAVMETLQADRPVGALVQGQPWWKQKRVLYGVGGAAALALLVVVLMAIWPPTQADPGAAAVTPERAGIGQSKAVVRPEEGKRSHEKKSGGASTVPPEVKPASGVVLPAANGGATALTNPGAVVPPGGDPVQVPGTQPPSGPIVVTGPEGAVPEGQNPIKVVPATPKSDTPKGEKPKAVVPTSPKAPAVQPTVPKEPTTPVVPGSPTSPVGPQTPTTPEPLKTPEVKGPADPKSPITPTTPIQSPATDTAVPGTPGTAKKDPKRPRKSMWSEPDMEGMEDEMKKELKKSLEMWQLDPNGESGIEME